MKIKRKVEMNEKELIKYLVDHESTTIRFSGISYDGAWLSIEPEIESKVHFEFKDASTFEKTFTVEVEEEITEDTHLDYLYVLTDAKDIHRCTNFTIKTASMVIGRDDLTFFTLVDNDLVKICDKGKLVE